MSAATFGVPGPLPSNLSRVSEETQDRDTVTGDHSESGLTLDTVGSSTTQVGESSSLVAETEPKDEYDTDLEIEEEKEHYDVTGSRVYLEVCKELGVVPASYFIRHMNSNKLDLRHHGLGPLGAKAIAIPLVSNTTVLTLDLEDNWLEDEGATYIAEMLKENCYVSELSLAENRIGSEGAVALYEMLIYNTDLTELNLSGNLFKDTDAPVLAEAILCNKYLCELNLSHNNFGEGAGNILGHAIGENETLEFLDLSWNQLRLSAAIDIIEGVKVNSRLKRVNLSYNGLGDEGAVALCDCLKMNSILLELDITNNRITAPGAMAIAKGLDTSETLEVFKMGENPITSAGAMMILQAINNDRSVLKKLHLTDVLVDKEFDQLCTEILESRENLEVHHGGILSNYVITGKYRRKQPDPEEGFENTQDFDDFLCNDPLAILKTLIEKSNVRIGVFFSQFDTNKDYRVSIEDFIQSIKLANIKLSEEQLETVVAKVDINKDKDGKIDYRLFLSESELLS